MKRKVIAILLSLTFIMTVLGGCGKNAQERPDAEKQKEVTDTVKVGFQASDLTNEFNKTIGNELKKLSEEAGYKYIEYDGALDQQKQNDQIEDMISQGIDILFYEPYDADGALVSLEACQKAGVKVITVDSNVTDTDLIETFVASDNYIAGYQTGEEIKRLYPDGCKIALLTLTTMDSIVQRQQGLEDALEGSNCEIVDEKMPSGMDNVLATSEDILTANPDIQVFWAFNDVVGLIAQGSVESSGKIDSVRVICIDGSPSGKQSVAQGGLWATAAQSPIGIADKAFECAQELLAGNKIESSYLIETKIVSQDNISEFDPDIWN